MLALEYRPKNFSDVLGQGHVTPILSAITKGESDPPPLLLFAGAWGVGKTTCARLYAAAFNCEEAEGDACGQCSSCRTIIEGGSSPAVVEIDAASTGGVADVERVRELCAHMPPTPRRVVIFDEAHSMSREAFNALLKMLEEPPERTSFVLVTTQTRKIPQTVRSRAIPFEFRPVPTVKVAELLWRVSAEQEFSVDPQLCVAIARETQGHVRDALVSLEQCRFAEVTTVEGYTDLLLVPDVSAEILSGFARSDLDAVLAAVDLFLASSLDVDRFLANLGEAFVGILAARSTGDEGPLSRYASLWSGPQVFAALRGVWDAQGRREVTDVRLFLRLVVTRLAEALGVELKKADVSLSAAFSS